MLRITYRREFHIYLTALYGLRRAEPILTRWVSMMTSTGFGRAPRKFGQDDSVRSTPYGVVEASVVHRTEYKSGLGSDEPF